MTDNHFSDRLSNDVRDVLTNLGVKHVLIRPHYPWQNGKVERLNRTPQVAWAYRQVFASNDQRAAALAPWSSTTTLSDTTQPSAAPHSARVTNLTAGYT